MKKLLLRTLAKRFLKKKRGFTLVEVVAVMAIIGVMAMALIPSIDTAINRSKDTNLAMDLANIGAAAKVYQLENGSYPESLNTLIEGKYLPDKTYKDATGAAISWEKTTGLASGTDSRGNTVKSDGTKTAAATGETEG